LRAHKNYVVAINLANLSCEKLFLLFQVDTKKYLQLLRLQLKTQKVSSSDETMHNWNIMWLAVGCQLLYPFRAVCVRSYAHISHISSINLEVLEKRVTCCPFAKCGKKYYFI
jgi:hypothetical protein